ncbi:hypothetical protein V6N13_123229 [Hibiscus sabdariffa]
MLRLSKCLPSTLIIALGVPRRVKIFFFYESLHCFGIIVHRGCCFHPLGYIVDRASDFFWKCFRFFGICRTVDRIIERLGEGLDSITQIATLLLMFYSRRSVGHMVLKGIAPKSVVVLLRECIV